MAIRVAWDRTPVSIHGTKDELLMLIQHLRDNHSYRKHSIVMPDRENDEEAVFFLYSPCDPRWIAEVMYCLLYTSPSPRDATLSRMPSSA